MALNKKQLYVDIFVDRYMLIYNHENRRFELCTRMDRKLTITFPVLYNHENRHFELCTIMDRTLYAYGICKMT